MSTIDYVIIILLLVGSVNGFFKGLINQLAGFFGIFLAVWGSFQFSNLLEDFLVETGKIPQSYVSIVSLIVVFFLIYLAIKLVAKILQKSVQAIGLGIFNKLGGAAFGALIITLIICAMVLYLSPLFNFVAEEKMNESQLVPIFYDLASTLKNSLF